MKLDGAEKREFLTQEAKTLFARNQSCADLKMKCANEYATPTHNARMTNVYSVSFPV